MIFGVIAQNYKSKLVFIESTVDHEGYIENICESNFISDLDSSYGKFDRLFMQDGARAHTALKTIEWLEKYVDLIIDWPANSPDLNPIEMLWAIMKMIISEEQPSTIQELKNVLEKTWNDISINLINKLCSSFRDRLLLCQGRRAFNFKIIGYDAGI